MNVTQAVNRLGKFASAMIILAGGLAGLSRMSLCGDRSISNARGSLQRVCFILSNITQEKRPLRPPNSLGSNECSQTESLTVWLWERPV